MSFRKELKYRFSFYEIAEIKRYLLALGMIELHPARTINSCYYDSRYMSAFTDSEEGILPRKKIRVRWYDHDLVFTKETKISSIEGRYKYSEEVHDINTVGDAISQVYWDRIYGELFPSMLVTYEREYHLFKSMRVTFDTNICYKRLRDQGHILLADAECVMEIKVPVGCSDDYVMFNLNIPTSRFSKYSRALLISQNML